MTQLTKYTIWSAIYTAVVLFCLQYLDPRYWFAAGVTVGLVWGLWMASVIAGRYRE